MPPSKAKSKVEQRAERRREKQKQKHEHVVIKARKRSVADARFEHRVSELLPDNIHFRPEPDVKGYLKSYPHSKEINTAFRVSTAMMAGLRGLGLTVHEAFAIYAYTRQHHVLSVYEYVNRQLRDRTDSLPSLYSFLCLLQSAVKKLSRHPQLQVPADTAVFRGMDILPSDFEAKYRHGSTVAWTTLGGASKNMNVALRFAKVIDGPLVPVASPRVLFELRGSPAVVISTLSRHPEEEEVMLGLDTQWRVGTIRDVTHPESGVQYKHVVLQYQAQSFSLADSIPTTAAQLLQDIDITPQLNIEQLNAFMSSLATWAPDVLPLVDHYLRQQQSINDEGHIILYDNDSHKYFIDENTGAGINYLEDAGDSHVTTIKAALKDASEAVQELLMFAEDNSVLTDAMTAAIGAGVFSLDDLNHAYISDHERPAHIPESVWDAIAASNRAPNVEDGEEIDVDDLGEDDALLGGLRVPEDESQRSWRAYIRGKWNVMTRNAAGVITATEVSRTALFMLKAVRTSLAGNVLVSIDIFNGASFGITRLDAAISVVVFCAQAAVTMLRYLRGDLTSRQAFKIIAATGAGVAGSIGGAAGGAYVGSAVGTFFCPGAGTLIGGIIGALLGSIFIGVAAQRGAQEAANYFLPDGDEEDIISRRKRYFHAIGVVKCSHKDSWPCISSKFRRKLLELHPDKIKQQKEREATQKELQEFGHLLIAWKFVEEYRNAIQESLALFNLRVSNELIIKMDEVRAKWKQLSTQQQREPKYRYAYAILEQHAGEPGRRKSLLSGFFDTCCEATSDFHPSQPVEEMLNLAGANPK